MMKQHPSSASRSMHKAPSRKQFSTTAATAPPPAAAADGSSHQTGGSSSSSSSSSMQRQASSGPSSLSTWKHPMNPKTKLAPG
eukprot:jgi/Chrzof1/6398/Cz18g09060.t1